MSYNSNTGRIAVPVSLNDIGQALSSSSRDLGALCRSENVNMWARFKPTKYKSLGLTGKTSGSVYWKGDDRAVNPPICAGLEIKAVSDLTRDGVYSTALGTDSSVGNHGIEQTLDGKLRFTDDKSFLYKLTHGTLGWKRSAPSGGAGVDDYPYRQLDFDGYNAQAECPLPASPVGGSRAVPSGITTLIGQIPEELPPDSLQLTDITLPSVISTSAPALSSFYLTVILYKQNGTDMFWKSAQAPLSNTGVEDKRAKISVSVPSSRIGEWKMRAFLSSEQLDSDTDYTLGLTSNDGLFFVIADTEERSIIFTTEPAGDVEVNVTSAKWVGLDTIHVGGTIVNNTNLPLTITKIEIFVQDVATLSDYASVILTTPSSIAAGSSARVSYTFTRLLPTEDSLSGNIVVYFRIGQISHTESGFLPINPL